MGDAVVAEAQVVDRHAVLGCRAWRVQVLERQDHRVPVQRVVVLHVRSQRQRRAALAAAEEYGAARHPPHRDLVIVQLVDELLQAALDQVTAGIGQPAARAPRGEHGEDDQPDAHRQVAALFDLDQVGRQEHQDEGQEQRAHAGHLPVRAAVAHPLEREEQGRGHGDGADHGHAVGRGQLLRALEHEHQRQHGDHEQPVHERHVDLPLLPGRGVHHPQARQVSQPRRLVRYREGARDHRLRGDHRGHRGQHHHRDLGPVGTSRKNGLLTAELASTSSAPWPR